MFSAETASHEFHLNITGAIEMFYILYVNNSWILT